MIIRFILLIIPIPILFSPRSNPYKRGASWGPFIIIGKDFKKDEGLIQHELVHCRQWYVTLGMSFWLYLFSKKYRLWAEVSAFAKQASMYTGEIREDKILFFTECIVNNYGLNVTSHKVREMLWDKVLDTICD